MLPITIGGFGLREGSYAALLSLFGIPSGQSVFFSMFSFALMVILTPIFWMTIIGVLDWSASRELEGNKNFRDI